MQGNFQIVSYKDYPLIPDQKQPLAIDVSISDIRYQLVFDANDDIKCGELLLTWRAKPNGIPHKQTLPRWFYVDELVTFNDCSGKIAALQYKGHTKHTKMAPVEASTLKINLHTALASEQYAELLPNTSPFLLKNVRPLSSSLATQLIGAYEEELPDSINETNIVNTILGNELQLLWHGDLPAHEHPALLKEWASNSDDISTAYLDVFESASEIYVDDFLNSYSDLLLQQHTDIEQSIATFDMLIRSGGVERFLWVIRMRDSDRALVASLELKKQ
jgi:hypothetical protein